MPVKVPEAELLGREDDFHDSDVESIHICFLIKNHFTYNCPSYQLFLERFFLFYKGVFL
jgi:hypothetical protein